MTTTTERRQAWHGPALLEHGFRPFFLLAGLWAAGAMALWLAMLSGRGWMPSAFGPVDWHAHALLFGFTSAAIAGFLLTAVPNWTGRLPVTGWPLAGLVALWVAGRAATGLPVAPSPLIVALCDMALPAALIALLTREVIAGRNWRNLPVLGLLGLFAAGQALFHWQAASGQAAQGEGARLGMAAVIMLIALIGGRITPSFSRNWLAARGIAALPAPFGAIDRAALGITALALGAFVAAPEGVPTAVLLMAAGVALLLRLGRWQGHRLGAEPLIWVLHLAYALLGLGFLAAAAGAAGSLSTGASRHLWLAGAVGLMILAVMCRASLGHTGRTLTAGPATAALFALVAVAALARLGGAMVPGATWLLHLSGAAWIGGFAGFVLLFGPVLTGPRQAPRRPAPAPSR